MKGPAPPLVVVAFLAFLGAVLEITLYDAAPLAVWLPKVPVLAFVAVALLRRRAPAP